MNLDATIENAANARPGYSLASFKEAALPVYVLTARILTLEKKALSPIEEGVLRALDAGLTRPEQVESFLGLPKTVLTAVLAALNARECVSYSRASGVHQAQAVLTEKGRQALAEAKSIRPQERVIKLVFDPLLKQVLFVSPNTLLKPREVKDMGRFEVPLCGAARPEIVDVPLGDLDKVVARMRSQEEETRELLALRRIERREMHFVPCVMMFYRATNGSDVQVAFHRDDGFSVDHENAFRELGGPEVVGARNVLAPPDLTALTDDAARKAELAELVHGEQGIAVNGEEDGRLANSASTQSVPIRKTRAMTQRLVRCHEHPTLLTKALTSTHERLLIISPWITHQVVNRDFLRLLEALLQNGVEVFIGYGLADDAPGGGKVKQKLPITSQAERDLTDLTRRFQNLTLQFVGNTHRKHLVSDDRFAVITSFNWLSFRGDPKQKARDELGFLVTEPTDVEAAFKDGMALLEEGYRHPTKLLQQSSEGRKRTA